MSAVILYQQTQRILNLIQYKDFKFEAIDDHGTVFLVVKFMAPDFKTGKGYENVSRRWYISPYMTLSEVVKTAWLAVSQVEEHERREAFTVLDAAGNPCRPFNPHLSIEALMGMRTVEYGLYAERDAGIA